MVRAKFLASGSRNSETLSTRGRGPRLLTVLWTEVVIERKWKTVQPLGYDTHAASRCSLPWRETVGGKLDLFQAKNQAATGWTGVQAAYQLVGITVRPLWRTGTRITRFVDISNDRIWTAQAENCYLHCAVFIRVILISCGKYQLGPRRATFL